MTKPKILSGHEPCLQRETRRHKCFITRLIVRRRKDSKLQTQPFRPSYLKSILKLIPAKCEMSCAPIVTYGVYQPKSKKSMLFCSHFLVPFREWRTTNHTRPIQRTNTLHILGLLYRTQLLPRNHETCTVPKRESKAIQADQLQHRRGK